jgi:predicted nucleic acid-binding protein
VLLVVDASVALSWCFEDETTETGERALTLLETNEAVVPALWWWEVANVLVVAQRRSRLTEAQASRSLAVLQDLPLRTDDAAPAPQRWMALAAAHGLSAYDASYLELAERLGATLATTDEALVAAAQRAGVTLA